MPTAGPNTPTQALEKGPRSLPSDLAPDEDLSKVHLTADEVRQRLAARERDIQYHVDALKHEALSVFDDVNVGGRPLMDRIRERKAEAMGAAAGAGAVVGLLLGLGARLRRRPDEEDAGFQFVQARLDSAVEDAARRVARGADVDDAIEDSMDALPVLYGDGSKIKRPKTSGQQVAEVALTTAVGFAVKTAMDLLVQRYTDHQETFAALGDEVE